MELIRVDNPYDSYGEVLSTVLRNGTERESRGLETAELRNLAIEVYDPYYQLVAGVQDSYFTKEEMEFLVSEITTIREGNPPEQEPSEELKERLDLDDWFYEDIVRERISTLWGKWVKILEDQPETRKVIAGFTDGIDSPCTTSVQFLGGEELDMTTYNRSTDMMYGYRMDMIMFETLQCMLADETDMEVGTHNHVMASAHVYREQIEEAYDMATEYSS